MKIHNPVIWYEGMLLAPQHFQQQTRYVEYLMRSYLQMQHNYYYGFSQLEINTDLLKVGKIGIVTAHGIFPDGTVFNIPTTDKIPPNLHISEKLNNTQLLLALPITHISDKEIAEEGADNNLRYRAFTRNIIDTCKATDEAIDMSVGTLDCHILTEHDDLNNYVYLPLLKIKEVTSQAKIKIDKTFIAPWLDAHQDGFFGNFLKEIKTLLSNRCNILASRLTDAAQAGTTNIVDQILLQLSNRYLARLNNLTQASSLHPKALYDFVVEMIAELSTYTTDERHIISFFKYQHDNLFATFHSLSAQVSRALTVLIEQNAQAIELQSQGYGLWVGDIAVETVITENDLILAVLAEIPLEEIYKKIPLQVKIAPIEIIHKLVSRSLPGINLEKLSAPPRQVPYRPNFCYFKINNNHPLSENIQRSKQIALHITGELPNLQLELWAVKR